MSVPAYPEYKDSGVAWLGEVPSHWPVQRITNLYREVVEPGNDDLPILSVSIHSGVSDDELAADEVERKVSRSDDRSKYKQVQPNDLVYNMMRAWQGGFGAVQVPGMVSPAYVVARPKGDVPSRYIELLLRTPDAVEEMRRRSRGITDFRLRLYWDEFKDMRIALPPSGERRDIIAFLDRETAKIDALVAEQERLIALLQEKRQAVISRAVTEGLNPNAPMKNSGIDWLGQIPAHWGEVRLSSITSLIQSGPFGSQLHAEDYIQDGVPVINPANIKDGIIYPDFACSVSEVRAISLAHQRLAVGDIIFGRRGEMGRCAMVPDDQAGWLCGTGCLNVRLLSIARPEFISIYLSSYAVREYLILASVGSTMDNLNATILGDVVVPLPPVSEQVKIADYISSAMGKLDTLVSTAKSATAFLQERRAALISAAVTGKIDVRTAVTASEMEIA